MVLSKEAAGPRPERGSRIDRDEAWDPDDTPDRTGGHESEGPGCAADGPMNQAENGFEGEEDAERNAPEQPPRRWRPPSGQSAAC